MFWPMQCMHAARGGRDRQDTARCPPQWATMGLSLFVTDFCTLGDRSTGRSSSRAMGPEAETRNRKVFRNQASMPSFAIRTVMHNAGPDWRLAARKQSLTLLPCRSRQLCAVSVGSGGLYLTCTCCTCSALQCVLVSPVCNAVDRLL